MRSVAAVAAGLALVGAGAGLMVTVPVGAPPTMEVEYVRDLTRDEQATLREAYGRSAGDRGVTALDVERATRGNPLRALRALEGLQAAGAVYAASGVAGPRRFALTDDGRAEARRLREVAP